ncbi:MAG TPA: HNH endonuclease signature motif containing protein [Candidatus Moranbacteria bacterium]|nr:HNH endonuclease signature motif containing protein [Candidatus Moranbacteria bacterium]
MIIIKTNRKRTWTEDQLRIAVKNSTSIRKVLSKLKLREAGGNYSQIKKYIEFYKIDSKHLKGRGWSRGLEGIGKPRIKLRDILVKGNYFQSYKLKKRLFEENLKPKYCEECGWHKISADGRLPLELDHINGDSTDNRLKNLRVLCPNCHSLKQTHRGKNRKRRT